MNSYPWYINNWLGSETRMRLSPLARGVYRELLDHCWKNGSLPKNAEVLAGMAAIPLKEFKKVWPELLQLFIEKDDRFHNATVDEKRPQLVEYKEKLSENGRKGAMARHMAQPQAQPQAQPVAPLKPGLGPASGPAQALILSTYNTDTTVEVQNKRDAPVGPQPPKLFAERFEEFWLLYPAHRRGHREVCERLLFQTATEDPRMWETKWERLIDPLRPGGKWIASEDWTKDAGRFVCKAQTYLMDSKWNETPMPAKVEEVWADHLKTVEHDERFR